MKVSAFVLIRHIHVNLPRIRCRWVVGVLTRNHLSSSQLSHHNWSTLSFEFNTHFYTLCVTCWRRRASSTSTKIHRGRNERKKNMFENKYKNLWRLKKNDDLTIVCSNGKWKWKEESRRGRADDACCVSGTVRLQCGGQAREHVNLAFIQMACSVDLPHSLAPSMIL